MAYFRQTSMYQWSGTASSETESKLLTPTLAGKAKYQAAQFSDLTSGSATQSEERWLGMKYIDPQAFTSLGNARVTKIHGTYQNGHSLHAGATSTYATPKTTGTPSTIATAAIPSHLITSFHAGSSPLSLAYDVTDSEYQFLVLQHTIGATTTSFDPEQQVGDSGYPIIEVAYPIEEKDGTRTLVPGGNDRTSQFLQSPIDVYVVVNEEQQFFGCTSNAITAGFSLEWENIVKGALNGIEGKYLTNRNNELSGELYSLNPYVWLNFLYGSSLGSNGVSTQIQVSSSWKPVKTVEVILDTISREGRRLTIHSPEAYLKINGDIALGEGPATMPWMIDLGDTYNFYVSDNLWDIHRFMVDITLT
jgi:hypothetical protein